MNLSWLRFGLTLGALVCGVLVWSPPSSAELPLTREQRYKKYVLQQQLKCLKRCEAVGYKRFYRCGPRGNRYQKARAGVYFRSCIHRCNATWFCRGYKRNVQARCPSMCLQQRKKTMPRKRWRYHPTDKQYRRWVRRFLKWQMRVRYACMRVCKNYNMICNIRSTVKLPPRTKIPKIESLRR